MQTNGNLIEIAQKAENCFFTELAIDTLDVDNIFISNKNVDLQFLLNQIEDVKEKYIKKYSELYSTEFIVSFLQYYFEKNKSEVVYKDNRYVFAIFYSFLKVLHRDINTDPLAYLSVKRKCIKNVNHYKVCLKGEISEDSFESILNLEFLKDYYYIYPYLLNVSVFKDRLKGFDIWKHISEKSIDIYLCSYKSNTILLAIKLLRYASKLNSENLNKVFRREERENLDELRKQQILLGKIADEINEKIKEEVKTNPYICDNFYEIFSNLEPKTFKNNVTKLSGYGVMPIGEFFLSGGQLLNR